MVWIICLPKGWLWGCFLLVFFWSFLFCLALLDNIVPVSQSWKQLSWMLFAVLLVPMFFDVFIFTCLLLPRWFDLQFPLLKKFCWNSGKMWQKRNAQQAKILDIWTQAWWMLEQYAAACRTSIKLKIVIESHSRNMNQMAIATAIVSFYQENQRYAPRLSILGKMIASSLRTSLREQSNYQRYFHWIQI